MHSGRDYLANLASLWFFVRSMEERLFQETRATISTTATKATVITTATAMMIVLIGNDDEVDSVSSAVSKDYSSVKSPSYYVL